MRQSCVMRRCASAIVALLAAALLAAGCGSPAPRMVNAPHEAALATGQRAARALQRGQIAQALALYEQALAAADSVEDFDTSGAMLLNLALVHGRLNQPREAHRRVDRVLAAPARYAGALQSQAAARKSLLHLDAREGPLALQWADKAQAACGSPCGLAPLLANVRGQVAFDAGDGAQAAAQAARAAELAAAAGQQTEQANALRLLGRARSRLGDHAGAAAALQRALDIDRALGLPDRIVLDLLYAGDNAAAQGQISAAREFFDRALQVATAADLPAGVQAARTRLQALPPR
jgi:tetratricopeptide (TPR) repeat protein